MKEGKKFMPVLIVYEMIYADLTLNKLFNIW